MNPKFDVLVIGAGPAGTIAAAKFLQDGFTVKIIEKMEFPRFVIGESLLPHSMDYLDELDLLDCVRAQNFQLKTGARFKKGDQICSFLFDNQHTDGWKYTYQVKRADFDAALASEVERKGAVVEFSAEITAVETSQNLQTVTYTNKNNEECIETARFVVDASGYGRVLPRLFGIDKPVPTPPRGAIFAHYTDAKRTETEGANILVHSFNDNKAWMWCIPFSDNTTSVGIVSDTDYIATLSENNCEPFKELIASGDFLEGRYQKNDFRFEPRIITNYAVSVDRFHGEGYILCGNSTEFLDPIFSSGVTLAISSGYKAASLVSKQLKGESVSFDTYSAEMQKGVDVFRSYVNAWYDGSLQKIFFTQQDNEVIKTQICSVLAGYVWDQSNPFVAKHKTILQTLAKVVSM